VKYRSSYLILSDLLLHLVQGDLFVLDHKIDLQLL
jgi:hypothetical protein